MDVAESAEIVPMGEGIEVEELFLSGNTSDVSEFYDKCYEAVKPNGNDFTVKILARFRNVIYVRFVDDTFVIGKFLKKK